MTQETLKNALAINDELNNLSLSKFPDAHHIIPLSLTLSFMQPDIDGIQRRCTAEVPLSDEMRQIIRNACEDRIEELKIQLARL